MDGIKIVAMLLTIWGFASYYYQQYLDDKKAKKNESSPSFMFNKEMMSKIKEISGRMSQLTTRRTILGLRQSYDFEGATKSSTMKQRLQPTSLVNEPHVYGREKEKADIVEMLLRNDGSNKINEVCVIPIVGMGGISKTTLAKIVYKDNSTKIGQLKSSSR
ncbi:NB-ARC domain-containing protein [Corchorus olitorius]|uniref:NB-ARC domain-containing protein n=1 Tax=Corchorus olitorius TaxID=93759 RepID=A0A1R3I8S5_9ROSI|nr:NB-ARC domain-containing protein [Corchorus olitorius]